MRLRGETKLYVEPLYILAEIAAKYDLNLTQLIDALLSAWINQSARYGPLLITYRNVKDTDIAMFLITDHETVVSQFPIKTTVLEHSNRFKEYLRYIPIHEIREHYGHQEPVIHKIGKLHNKMKHVNLTAKIMDILPMKRVPTKYGKWAYLTNIQIADDTGSIQLNLWENQQQTLEVGDTIELINGYVTEYQGELQLNLGRAGNIIKQKKI